MSRLVYLIFSMCFLFFCAIPCVHAQSIKELYEKATDAYNARQYEESVALYKQVIQVMPNFAPGYNGLGLALKSSGGDADEVVNYFKMAIHYDPNYILAYDSLGRFYFDIQDYDHAEEYFSKALKIDPNMVSAKLSLAWVYLMARGRPAKAVAYFKQVLAAEATPNTYFGLGLAYFANNQRAEALDIITKLHKIGSEDLATRLENTVRQNRWVNAEPQTSPTPNPVSKTSEQPTESINPNNTTPTIGVKVRLRDKLPE